MQLIEPIRPAAVENLATALIQLTQMCKGAMADPQFPSEQRAMFEQQLHVSNLALNSVVDRKGVSNG